MAGMRRRAPGPRAGRSPRVRARPGRCSGDCRPSQDDSVAIEVARQQALPRAKLFESSTIDDEWGEVHAVKETQVVGEVVDLVPARPTGGRDDEGEIQIGVRGPLAAGA